MNDVCSALPCVLCPNCLPSLHPFSLKHPHRPECGHAVRLEGDTGRDMKCAACQELLRFDGSEPVMAVECGHLFDVSCFQRLFSRGSMCTECGVRLSGRVVRKTDVGERVRNVRVHCVYESRGCASVVTLGTLEGHVLQQCPYTIFQCCGHDGQERCNFYGTRDKLMAHTASCPLVRLLRSESLTFQLREKLLVEKAEGERVRRQLQATIAQQGWRIQTLERLLANQKKEKERSEGWSRNHWVCDTCGDGGTLLCCDRCPRTYHPKCLNLDPSNLPEGPWFCTQCTTKRTGGDRDGGHPHPQDGSDFDDFDHSSSPDSPVPHHRTYDLSNYSNHSNHSDHSNHSKSSSIESADLPPIPRGGTQSHAILQTLLQVAPDGRSVNYRDLTYAVIRKYPHILRGRRNPSVNVNSSLIMMAPYVERVERGRYRIRPKRLVAVRRHFEREAMLPGGMGNGELDDLNSRCMLGCDDSTDEDRKRPHDDLGSDEEEGQNQEEWGIDNRLDIPDKRITRRRGERIGSAEVALCSCLERVFKRLWNHVGSSAFRQPVSIREAPDYYLVISHPMDLGTVHEKLRKAQYSSRAPFLTDIRLMVSNAHHYNRNKPENHEIIRDADVLWAECMAGLNEVDNELSQLERGHQVPPVSTSMDGSCPIKTESSSQPPAKGDLAHLLN